ncbi:hypothetical protein DEO72_LG10g2176 [Vigna unguiculata]|uniref:Uncharacterized protein n=1 Tax=Vigna unguiculata TaxID=3917 RepID=A0A4D6NAS5_VIGUN|nr:hypothetical protein DEO72_LG10g2176 [Vigna unguiculata]
MCLPSIRSHNSRDIILSHNSRNAPARPSLRYHPKPYRPYTSKSHKPLPLHYHLALLQRRQAKASCRSPKGSRKPPCAIVFTTFKLSLGGIIHVAKR